MRGAAFLLFVLGGQVVWLWVRDRPARPAASRPLAEQERAGRAQLAGLRGRQKVLVHAEAVNSVALMASPLGQGPLLAPATLDAANRVRFWRGMELERQEYLLVHLEQVLDEGER
jgi:hypothetical protein